ncbi:MAG: M20/M25/M40 family metallo-hydrolase [Anaerolineales bacterium]|nr:M20/M25/M40 family metallo-hydrolase [Anaerolineales bacterium]
MSFPLAKFAEKYLLAREAALAANPRGGTAGFELEWNMYDSDFKPVLTVGTGPDRLSFVDYLRQHAIPAWLADRNQLEVFHWMIEWVTQPHFSGLGAVYESRLLEAALYNALARAGREFGEKLYAFPGILLYPAAVGHDSIPGGWHLAKRRYLERCVDIYGAALATAGIHANLSLPEPLLSWDFMHLSPAERGDAHAHLDDYKNRVYIEGTRLMRAFGALFVATSAATPLRAERAPGGEALVRLSEIDSNRNYTFPNPEALDVANLYRSHPDYLRASYDLVERGVRFGNNNWTPVRARSFAEPVERLILTTSDQLHAIYHHGLYAAGEAVTAEAMAQQIERENLLARINLPMARVEVRTDEGGHPLDLDIANITFKELLLIQFYADPAFGRAFRYDHEDLSRARRNEAAAAHWGLRAEIENPFTGKPVGVRDFLRWTLEQLRPMGEALELWPRLAPLVEMASGAPNTAERMRERVLRELGEPAEAEPLVPVEVLKQLAVEREARVARDVEQIAAAVASFDAEAPKLRDILQRARDEVRHDPAAPIRFRPKAAAMISRRYADKTAEILDLAQQLIRIPSVTNCADERLDEVHRAGTLTFDYLRDAGLDTKYFDQHKYPAIVAGFPGGLAAPVMLSGHFDVVQPDPDDSQFSARLDGDYLWGRGAADMKTVVATYLVWMKDMLRAGPPYPAINLCLVGNEENGEFEPMGTPHVLTELAAELGGYAPRLFIAGERTGEKGRELFGEVCVENRGVMRFEVIARGTRAHSALAAASADLGERLLRARGALVEMFERGLTLHGEDGWHSQYRFPFINVGLSGVYNITADHGVMGVEIRCIPQDRLSGLAAEVQAYCAEAGLEFNVIVQEAGITCDPGNPYLRQLLDAVCAASEQPAAVGRKLPGTSARFAPGGQGVVWGQAGLGPHARDERHYVPSIEPYYRALVELGKRVR